MPALLDLPYQLLVDEVLTDLDVDSLLRMREVSHSLKQLVDDELVWRRKIREDFNFPLLSSARGSGWQKLYKGLKTPSIYTWGDFNDKRIGRKMEPESIPAPIWNIIIRVRCVPFPLQIDWRNAERRYDGNEVWSDDEETEPAVEIAKAHNQKWQGVPVQLHAGGWSFYALTDTGRILSWGSSAALLTMTTQSRQNIELPTVMDTHMRTTKMLTVGREHLAALMWNGELFEWYKTWDKPIRIQVPYLFQQNKDANSVNVIQVEAGWDFTAVLADVSNVEKEGTTSSTSKKDSRRIVFWKTKWTELWRDKYLRPRERTESPGRWSAPEIEMDGIILPPLPGQVVQIAAGDNFIMALTDDYMVYYLSIPVPERAIDRQIENILNRPDDVDDDGNNVPNPHEARLEMQEANRRDIERVMNQNTSFFNRSIRQRDMHWRKLDKFCGDLRSSGVGEDGTNIWDKEEYAHLVANETKITHISAHFLHFAVYAPEAGAGSSEGKGKGIVAIGTSDNVNEAIIIPELQGIQVIKVSHGDWHSGALTQNGRVLTWGQKSNGALGSWDAVAYPENTISALQTTPAVISPIRRMGRIMRLGFAAQAIVTDDPPAQPQPTGEEHMVNAEKERYMLRQLPEKVEKPLPIRFGFPKLGEQQDGRIIEADDQSETKYVFDIAFAGWHSGALAIDRSLLS